MDPGGGKARSMMIRLPRTRGDGPHPQGRGHRQREASPHTRGWTRHGPTRDHSLSGFPAHAGMDPPTSPSPSGTSWLPRTRGDGPRTASCEGCLFAASPHTRGWTRAGVGYPECRSGFPAHAGMDPVDSPATAASTGLPRTRGDGPPPHGATEWTRKASPHTRGWTPLEERLREVDHGFPAHAGMDR